MAEGRSSGFLVKHLAMKSLNSGEKESGSLSLGGGLLFWVLGRGEWGERGKGEGEMVNA